MHNDIIEDAITKQKSTSQWQRKQIERINLELDVMRFLAAGKTIVTVPPGTSAYPSVKDDLTAKTSTTVPGGVDQGPNRLKALRAKINKQHFHKAQAEKEIAAKKQRKAKKSAH